MDNWMEQNMDILRAMDIFGVKENELKKFGVEDTFNPPNRLYGFMCTRADHRYGSLVLFQVNGQECEQIIYGTPKLHYPFDKNGTYIWPDVREARGWDRRRTAQPGPGPRSCAASWTRAAGPRAAHRPRS